MVVLLNMYLNINIIILMKMLVYILGRFFLVEFFFGVLRVNGCINNVY